jgi:hypothetical protein
LKIRLTFELGSAVGAADSFERNIRVAEGAFFVVRHSSFTPVKGFVELVHGEDYQEVNDTGDNEKGNKSVNEIPEIKPTAVNREIQ